MNISIIILNWNAGDDTLHCIKPILAWRQLKPAIWVVDNASSDGSAEQIAARLSQAQLPQIKLIHNSQNQGFSGGTNRGIEAALAVSNAPILLLNNDAMIEEKDVLRLWETLYSSSEIGLIVPLLFESESGELLSAGGKNPVRHQQTRVRSFEDEAPVQVVEVVSGTAVLIRAALLKQIGLLDERFFFSTEMADLSLRAKRQGFLAAVDRRARAAHTVSRSSHLRDSLYTYYIIRNRFLILRNHTRWHLHLFGYWTVYSFALALKLWLTGSKATARAVWLGVWDGLTGRFGNQNERAIAFCNR